MEITIFNPLTSFIRIKAKGRLGQVLPQLTLTLVHLQLAFEVDRDQKDAAFLQCRQITGHKSRTCILKAAAKGSD